MTALAKARQAVIAAHAEHSSTGVCRCGHDQDEHGGWSGHGPCGRVEFHDEGRHPCGCEKFTWKGWTEELQAKLDSVEATVDAAELEFPE